MHDALTVANALRRDAPALGVLPQGRDEVRAREHPLALHAQHVDDVGVCDRLDVVRRRARALRHERRRADQDRVGADEPQRLDERARDARVQDVADDRDVQAVEPAERLAHRVEVEQRLRRVLVLPVAGVDDVRRGVVRDERRGAGLGVADDDHVGVVRGERQRRVLQRLALVDRRAGRLSR